MSFCWKRLRYLLPVTILFFGCLLAYWTFTLSSAPAVDVSKIQDQISSSDKSLGLKFEKNPNPKKQIKQEDFGEKSFDGVEDDYGELSAGGKEERGKETVVKDEVNWLDDKDIYHDNIDKDNVVDNIHKTELQENDEDEYIKFPTEKEIFLPKIDVTPGYDSSKVTVDFGVKESVEAAAPLVPGNDFDKEPAWKGSSRRKQQEPAAPFHDTRPILPKKSDGVERTHSISGADDLHNAEYGRKKNGYSQSFYVMMHGVNKSLVRMEMNAEIRYMPDDIPSEAYIFTSKVLPSDIRLRPSVGNGRIATVIHTPNVFFSGLYNGRMGESHRAVIPSTCSFNITETVPSSNFTRYYSLNVATGVYVEESVSRNYIFTYKVYAHRNLTNLMVVEVEFEKFDMANSFTLKVELNRWTASYDFTFRTLESDRPEVSYKVGRLNAPETVDSPDAELHVMYDHVPELLVPSSTALRTKWVFLTAYGTSREKVERSYNKGVSFLRGKDELLSSHVQAWGRLWNRGRVDIKGNLTLARAAYGSFYYLLSSLPLKMDEQFRGLSPSGLPLGEKDKDYQGRILWDQEIWMLPPILLFHPTLASIMLRSRGGLSAGAKLNAEKAKFTGLLYPWESGATGVELNSNHIRGALSPFVSSGIVFALQQLLYATNSTAISRQFGQMVTDIGHFLVSHKLTCRDDKCSVNNVLPFDDSHGIVSNSPFVNAIIQNALLVISNLDASQNKSFTNHWNSFASEIIIPFDETADFHPAYDFYRKDSTVKEADAVLLGYPLLHRMHPKVRARDLHYYESVLDPRASPMTWAVHAIGWLEIGDHARASAAFQRQLLFIRNEFQVWSNRTLGMIHASNYLSAMGAYLQSLVNGYGGVRLRSNCLVFDPTMLDGVDAMNLIGLDYLGSSMNVIMRTNETEVVVTGQLRRAVALSVYVYIPEEIHALKLHEAVRFRRRKFAIFSANAPVPRL